ncbi:MAG: putative zinc-binding protein [Desulfuromonadales bacterium]
MKMPDCCKSWRGAGKDDGYEVARIEKTKNNCALCDGYAGRQKSKSVAVLCCEGACLRGEVARQAANLLCHSLIPEKTVRICLGGAFTKESGQRSLVRNAKRLIALEGCCVNCSSRMMGGVIEGLTPELVIADRLYDFDRTRFGIDEMPPDEIRTHARTVAEKVAALLEPTPPK